MAEDVHSKDYKAGHGKEYNWTGSYRELMPSDILYDARQHLIDCLKGKHADFEIKHPWRKDWEFAVLHSLHVEAYALRILAYENHGLTEHEIILIRLAAILHDIARLDDRENHARMGAELTAKWFQCNLDHGLQNHEIAKVLEMIADHSQKNMPEQDFSKAVLKDADTLDEIGVMSIFMASNWLETHSSFFFHELRKRLVDFELPYCDKKLAILNTEGAREILLEKKAFLEKFIAQLTGELEAARETEQILLGLYSPH